MRKFTLFSLMLLSIIICFGSISLANENRNSEILTEKELEGIFPDSNFRNVIKKKIGHKDITYNDIKSLDGELDATGEKIFDLKGISTLENIDKFIFWNNNIKKIPSEILQLTDLYYINISNNYITDNKILELMKQKGITVNSDLNFIENMKKQYSLEAKFKSITINKDEKVDLRNIIEKNIKDYDKRYQLIKQVPKDLNLDVYIENPEILKESNMILEGKSNGTTKVTVYIQDKINKKQISTIHVNIK